MTGSNQQTLRCAASPTFSVSPTGRADLPCLATGLKAAATLLLAVLLLALPAAAQAGAESEKRPGKESGKESGNRAWGGFAQAAGEGPREPPPETVAPARAVKTPEALGAGRIDPTWAFQFGWGLHNLTVEAPGLGETFGPRSLTNDGANLTLEFVLGSFRLGYVRQFFRREPAKEIVFEEARVTLLGFASDQIWVFHGFRPVRRLYMGYGLGWQRREATLKRETVEEPGTEIVQATTIAFSERSAMAGLMVDWGFALPFTLQVRAVWEEGGGGRFFRVSGQIILLTYVVPF